MKWMLTLTVLLVLAPVAPVVAQVPDEFTNLKVFPEEIDKRALLGTMRGFTEALGVRCNHCHVGEDPESLEGYDFASDEKETKRTARVMLQMVQAINGTHLPSTERAGFSEVTCTTCHRGITKPQQLKDLMLAAIEADGMDAAIAHYRELRAAHYGGGAYDFSAGALDGVTEVLAMGKQDLEGAMTINRLNLEFYPEAPYTLYLNARLKLLGGDREGAIATLEKAIAANPEVGWLVGQLEELKKAPPEG